MCSEPSTEESGPSVPIARGIMGPKELMMAYQLAGRHNGFKVRIQEVFWRQSTGSRLIKIAANSPIYTSGQRDATVYLIESGKVKLVLPTPEGTSCLLAMRTAGDIF